MTREIENETVKEALRYAERGVGGIETLHLGPLDYNITTAADYLRTAANLLEQYQRDQAT
jgi:hypothetical protein